MNTRHLSTKYGNPAQDQIVQTDADGETFVSYGTPIAHRANDGTLRLTRYWNYSATTNYYRGRFTGYGAPETRKLIASGDIKVVDRF